MSRPSRQSGWQDIDQLESSLDATVGGDEDLDQLLADVEGLGRRSSFAPDRYSAASSSIYRPSARTDAEFDALISDLGGGNNADDYPDVQDTDTRQRGATRGTRER